MMTSSSDELLRRGVEPVVVIDHLRVVRGKRPALHDLSVQIARGTITGLLGPSGCGKTTLMRSIVGHPDRRRGHRHGARAARRAPLALRSRVGYVTQDADDLQRPADRRQRPLLRARCTAWTPRPQTRRSRRSGWTTIEPRCAATYPAANAPGCRWPARWWLHPDLLVLDEPTVGLDPVLRVELWEQFDQLARRGTTLVVSSHVMDEADHCGDLLLMRDGHLLAHTTPTKLREDTGCQSLEEAFLSVIRHSTAAAAG